MLETVRKIIKQSNKIVFMTGLGSVVECGGRDLWSSDIFYEIERKYKMCPEQLLSAGEYSSRKERFYNFYKKEVISYLPKPDETYEIIKALEDEDRLEAVVSFNIFGLEKLAGIKNVVEVAGSVYDNYCPKCNKTFDVDYLLNSRSIPVCDECKKALRPNIRLLGERVDNDLYTKSAIHCSEADTIIILGMDLESSKVQYVTGHYKGSNLILFAKEEKYGDKFADYVIYGNIRDNIKEAVK
ncbi:NAD-dependent deacetylase [Lachnospiraceae bacterium G41]|nr:NAD-dependent deacetylase [Lachnospiraceae bacterium G41]